MAIRRFATGILLMSALLLAACGSAQQTGVSGPTAAASAPTVAAPASTAPAMPTAEGTMPTAESTTTAMGHGGMEEGNASVPYDAQFIDSMIEHHQGAIDMANQALQEATRPELKTLAQSIVTAQEAEIQQLQGWRGSWYPDLAPTGGMGMDMGDMQISDDASKPLDQRFIEAMIPHHQGAIAMAEDAQQKAEHTEIKTLAQNIITAQEQEIAQMQQWQSEWFPK